LEILKMLEDVERGIRELLRHHIVLKEGQRWPGALWITGTRLVVCQIIAESPGIFPGLRAHLLTYLRLPLFAQVALLNRRDPVPEHRAGVAIDAVAGNRHARKFDETGTKAANTLLAVRGHRADPGRLFEARCCRYATGGKPKESFGYGIAHIKFLHI